MKIHLLYDALLDRFARLGDAACDGADGRGGAWARRGGGKRVAHAEALAAGDARPRAQVGSRWQQCMSPQALASQQPRRGTVGPR
jgi:hypothetical protein